jgi:hypothetical protein
MKNKNAILLVSVLILGLLTGGAFVKYTTPPYNNSTSSNDNVSNSAALTTTDNSDNEPKSTKTEIDYETFSSPKADFTFEYPNTWKYDEKDIDGTTVWNFYPNLDKNYNNVPSYLELHTPIEDPGAVDFYSNGPENAKEDSKGFTLSVFPTNDPKTFVTYERYGAGETGGGYIYWQKGEYFANATSLFGHDKYNLMRFYSAPESEQEVGLHIAQSIKIK